ncbi:MAG: DUF4397 domain-containing protein [Pseudomonadales bacterium]|nr:DUF4397 domain-containing protein [Pseudomonadales bacterium]
MKKLGLGVIALSTSLLWGCGGDSNNNSSADEDRAQAEAATASVRAVHLSPDAPAVDVLVNGDVALEDVAYRDASGFLAVAEGTQSLAVNVADTTTTVISADLALAADTKYTVLAVNNVASIEPLVITDTDTPADGFAQITVVHGAPAAPAVDVYVSAPDADFSGLSATLSNIPFKAVSDELEVPAGDYRVRVTLNGESDVIYDSGALALADGVEYIAVASEVSEGLSPIGLTVLTDIDSTPFVLVDDARTRVRVAHASADAPEVDVSVDSAAVLTDVPFGVASGYLELLGDTYNIDVAASSSGASVINADLAFDARQDYTVIALNDLANIEALILEDDNSAPGDGNVKVRLVHGAKSAGLVDVYITAPGADISAIEPSISDFAFKADSGYLEVAAGTYQVRITGADSKGVAIDTGALTLAAGVVRTAIALDPPPASSDFGVLLLEDLN